jgi:hypothetical protein
MWIHSANVHFQNPCCDPNPDSNEPVDPDPGTQRWPIRIKIKKVQVLTCLLIFWKDWGFLSQLKSGTRSIKNISHYLGKKIFFGTNIYSLLGLRNTGLVQIWIQILQVRIRNKESGSATQSNAQKNKTIKSAKCSCHKPFKLILKFKYLTAWMSPLAPGILTGNSPAGVDRDDRILSSIEKWTI